jgi:hypothetical protein
MRVLILLFLVLVLLPVSCAAAQQPTLNPAPGPTGQPAQNKGSGQAAEKGKLTESEKETVASIREITLQLLLLAIGVVALLAGYAADKEKTFSHLPLAWVSILSFALSVIAGLLTYGNVIYMLGKDSFSAFGAITNLAMIQWTSFGLAGAVFMVFVLKNMRSR